MWRGVVSYPSLEEEREGSRGSFENPHESYLKDVNCRKKWISEIVLRRFQHLLLHQNGSCSVRSWCTKLCILCQETDSGRYLLSRFLAYLGFHLEFLETFLPHSVQSIMPRFCCIRILKAHKKAGKEIQIKITWQEESSSKRMKPTGFVEGAFDVSYLCVTCSFTWPCVMRLLCLSGVGSTTCSLYTWQRWMLTQTAAGNCCHRVSKPRSVCGAPVVCVSAAYSPFLLSVVDCSNERLPVLLCLAVCCGVRERASLS